MSASARFRPLPAAAVIGMLAAAPATAQVRPGAPAGRIPAGPPPGVAGHAPAAPARPALAGPVTVEQAEVTLRALFAGYELVPTVERLRRLGDALGPALLRIAGDRDEDLVVRARAVSSLVHVPAPATADALVRLLRDPAAPSLLRRKAVLVLGEAFGAEHLALVAETFAAAADDVPLREACARALRAMGPDAWATREWLLANETAPTVQALLREDKDIRPGRPE